MSLGFRVYKEDDTPLYVQAADALRARLYDGEYRLGDRLPSVRRLSDELGVNPATVVAAYRILSSEGLIESRAGSGAFVCGVPASEGSEDPEARPPRDASPERLSPIDGASDSPPLLVDLSSNAPPRQLYPLDDMKRFLVDAVDLDEGRAFDYEGPAGYAPLRDALAARLSIQGSLAIDPRDIHVVSGAQQGLDLASRLLLRRGDVAAVESPGYRGAYESFLAAGARVMPIAVGEAGLDLDALEKLASSRPLRLVYVNPSLQNPTACVYGQEARERLALMAARHGFYVLEDDQLSELGHGNTAPASVRSFDSHGRVIYVKSFSKTLMPGLRIAALEAPQAFRERIEASKRAVDLSSNGLMQRVLERFLSSGRYDSRLPELRLRYRQSAELFMNALEPYRSVGLSWRRPEGGLSLWLRLPESVAATRLATRLAREGYAVVAEAAFRHEPGQVPDAHLRLSFGSANPEALPGAARAVAELAMGEAAAERRHKREL